MNERYASGADFSTERADSAAVHVALRPPYLCAREAVAEATLREVRSGGARVALRSSSFEIALRVSAELRVPCDGIFWIIGV